MPTRDRREVLAETLQRLGAVTEASAPIELVLVDDGSGDGTAESVAGLVAGLPWPTLVLQQPATGPAAARNRGLRESSAAACLFMGDDIRPRSGMVERHLGFHRAHPQETEAMLGLVVPAPPLDREPFVRWLHENGTQFGYGLLDPSRPVSPQSFWTSNVSVKRTFALDAGGFDESFPGAACEDAELGLRLGRRGMRLHFDPSAVAEHYHPTDLERTLSRMRTVGVAYRRLCDVAPEIPEPTRPGARHRLKAMALTPPVALRVRPPWIREATWRFLCDEAQREAYWGIEPRADGTPRIGSRLARLTRD